MWGVLDCCDEVFFFPLVSAKSAVEKVQSVSYANVMCCLSHCKCFRLF